MEVEKLDNHEKIVSALGSVKIPFTTFACPEMLNTFFNKPGFNLYSIRNGESVFFFIQKDRTKEVRFLFVIPPNRVVDYVKNEFKSPYIAGNDLFEKPDDPNAISDIELTVNLEEYITLKDADVRKQYNRALRSNKGLIFKNFSGIPKEDLEIFWKAWAEQKSLASEKFKDRTDNDNNFLSLYSKDHYFGVGAYDGSKLVAYSIGIPFDKDKCLSGFNKVLRGYTNLGLQISYEKAKIALEKGFKYMNIGSINNDFKKQFISFSEQQNLYGTEIWRSDIFKTLLPYGYTGGLFW